MPETHRFATALGLGSVQFVGMQRYLLSELMQRMRIVTSYDFDLSMDHLIATFIVLSIGPTEETIHSRLPFWLSFIKSSVKKLDLCDESLKFSREEKEERKRFGTTLS
jgi:hypothetical protein